MPLCFYCRTEKPEEAFLDPDGGRRRAREHVIPQSFGMFQPANLVLRCVCVECNRVLGRDVDTPFARDSIEGHVRGQYGLVGEVRGCGPMSRTRFEVRSDDPDLDGVVCFRSPDPKQPGLQPVPQIRLRLGDDSPKSYTLDTRPHRYLPPLPRRDELGLAPGSEVWMSIHGYTREQSLPILVSYGYRMSDDGPREITSPPRVRYELFAPYGADDRAIAKIALNYVAATVNPGYASTPAFDAIWRFVREGSGPSPVRVYENRTHPQPAHFIRLVMYMGEVYAHVSIFMLRSYFVRVTQGLKIDGLLSHGHTFGVLTRCMYPFPGFLLLPECS